MERQHPRQEARPYSHQQTRRTNTFTLLRDAGGKTEEMHQRIGTIEETLVEWKEERTTKDERAKNLVERLVHAVAALQQRNENYQTIERSVGEIKGS